jgi:hypothetical protein
LNVIRDVHQHTLINQHWVRADGPLLPEQQNTSKVPGFQKKVPIVRNQLWKLFL